MAAVDSMARQLLHQQEGAAYHHPSPTTTQNPYTLHPVRVDRRGSSEHGHCSSVGASGLSEGSPSSFASSSAQSSALHLPLPHEGPAALANAAAVAAAGVGHLPPRISASQLHPLHIPNHHQSHAQSLSSAPLSASGAVSASSASSSFNVSTATVRGFYQGRDEERSDPNYPGYYYRSEYERASGAAYGGRGGGGHERQSQHSQRTSTSPHPASANAGTIRY